MANIGTKNANSVVLMRTPSQALNLRDHKKSQGQGLTGEDECA